MKMTIHIQCLFSPGGTKKPMAGIFAEAGAIPKTPRIPSVTSGDPRVQDLGGLSEKLAAAHLNDERRPDTHKTAGFRQIADKPSSGDPPCKIPKGSLPRSSHRM